MSTNTIRFNVGGIPLEISAKYIQNHPRSNLQMYSHQASFDQPYFIDKNPYVFLTILDYLRTGKLYVPRNTNTELVMRCFKEYNLEVPKGWVETDSDLSLPGVEYSPFQGHSNIISTTFSQSPYNPNFKPPAYETSNTQWSSYLDQKSPSFSSNSAHSPSQSVVQSNTLESYVTLSRGKKIVKHPTYTTSLDSQQTIMYKKMEPLIFQHLLRIISKHVDAGHCRLRIYILPPNVKPEQIANDTNDEDLGFPKEYFVSDPAKECPEMEFLCQPKAMALLQKTLMMATGIHTNLGITLKNVTTRIETDFGLLESKSMDLVLITMEIPHDCHF